MLNAILPYMEDSGLWVKSNGPFDTDSDDVKRPDYEFDGERKTLMQWCKELRLDYSSMHYRLSLGMDFEDAADLVINEARAATSQNFCS